MADAIHFDVELGDLLSGPAHKAEKAVDDLSNELTKAKGKLAAYESQLKLANQLGDVEGHRKYSAAVEETSRKVYDLGNKLVDMKGQAAPAASALEQLGAAAGPAGVALAAVAAVVGVLYTVGRAGVETALEATAVNAQLEATFEALGKGPDAGKRTIEMLDDVSRSLPQSREELAKWTREIEKMGVTDLGQVRRELQATASAQAVLGEEGPAAFQKIERKIHDAIEGHHALKIASKELTKTIGTNLAGDAAGRMGLTLEQLEVKLKAGTVDAAAFGSALEESLIEKGGKGLNALWMSKAWSKIKESGRELFAGVDTSPITNGLRSVLGLLDQTQPSGQAMKTTITDAFNAIVKGIGYVITEGEVMSLEWMVYGLSMELALLPVWNILKQMGRGAERAGQALGIVEKPKTSLEAWDEHVKGTAPKSADQSKFESAAGTIQAANAISPALGVFASLGFLLSEGLSSGMKNGIPGVEGAGKEMGEAAAKGAADGAQVKSPSRLTMKVGAYMDEGLAIGLMGGRSARAGRQLSVNALGGLVGGALTSPAANGNGGGLTVHIDHLTITAPQGVTDANQLSATGLAVALERFQLGSGR